MCGGSWRKKVEQHSIFRLSCQRLYSVAKSKVGSMVVVQQWDSMFFDTQGVLHTLRCCCCRCCRCRSLIQTFLPGMVMIMLSMSSLRIVVVLVMLVVVVSMDPWVEGKKIEVKVLFLCQWKIGAKQKVVFHQEHSRQSNCAHGLPSPPRHLFVSDTWGDVLWVSQNSDHFPIYNSTAAIHFNEVGDPSSGKICVVVIHTQKFDRYILWIRLGGITVSSVWQLSFGVTLASDSKFS